MSPDLERYIARREAVLDRVRKLLVERLHVERDPDAIDPDTPLFGTGLGLDSVEAVEMVVSLEDTFGFKLPDDALGRRVMRTVGKLVDLVLSYEDQAAAALAAAGAGAPGADVAAGAEGQR
jgi:acyl carrier protein